VVYWGEEDKKDVLGGKYNILIFVRVDLMVVWRAGGE
jgi:hypothetical protein